MTAILGKIKKWEMELLAVGLLPLVLGLTRYITAYVADNTATMVSGALPML